MSIHLTLFSLQSTHGIYIDVSVTHRFDPTLRFGTKFIIFNIHQFLFCSVNICDTTSTIYIKSILMSNRKTSMKYTYIPKLFIHLFTIYYPRSKE